MSADPLPFFRNEKTQDVIFTVDTRYVYNFARNIGWNYVVAIVFDLVLGGATEKALELLEIALTPPKRLDIDFERAGRKRLQRVQRQISLMMAYIITNSLANEEQLEAFAELCDEMALEIKTANGADFDRPDPDW